MAMSVNTYFVQLEEKVGVPAVADMAVRLGMTSIPLTGPRRVGAREGSLTLGSREVSPLETAGAYATLAARGVRCTPTPLVSLDRGDGHGLVRTAPQCVRAVAPEVADAVTDTLRQVMTTGTGRANAALADRPSAGKTGTTQDNGAAWFVGYTPRAATAVWLGDPRGAAGHPLVGVLGRARMHGGDIPALIWHAVMAAEEKGKPPLAFAVPQPTALLAAQQQVPQVAGLDAALAARLLQDAGYRTAPAPVPASPAPVPADAGTGTADAVVTATVPAAGTAAAPGSLVRLRTR
jgi:membrane peptidoglycan carboxypeptidase